MADLSFDPSSGFLYGWGAQSSTLYKIDTAHGTAAAVGTGLNVSGGGGGLAFSGGTLYSAPDGRGAHQLWTVNPITGAATPGPTMSGLLSPPIINAMDVNGGLLYGVQTQSFLGSPPDTHLVTINTATGTFTDLGFTPSGLDAIAFAPPLTPVPEPSTIIVTGAALAGLFWGDRRRQRVAVTTRA